MAYSITKGTKFSVATYDGETLGTYADVSGFRSYPSLGGTPDRVDVTTLADGQYHYINGLKNLGDLNFGFVYETGTSNTNYRTLKALEDEDKVSVKITLPDTSTFTFDAQLSVSLDAGEVNGALMFTVSCALLSDITLA